MTVKAKQRRHQRHRYGQRQFFQILADDAVDKSDRNKIGQRRQHRGGYRRDHFFRSFDHRLPAGQAFLCLAKNIFDDDNAGVDNHPGSKPDAQQGDYIDAVVHPQHKQKRG